MCTIVGVASLALMLVTGRPIVGVLIFLLFHFGGVGVREHNPFAAAMVLTCFAIDTATAGVGVVRIIVVALLLSNLRATWIADHWKPESEEAALPPRLGETFSVKLADKWPAFIWPKIKWVYYFFSFGCLALMVSALIVLYLRRGHL